MNKRSLLLALLAPALLLLFLLPTSSTADEPTQGDGDNYLFFPFVAHNYDPTWTWTQVTTPTLSPSPFNSPSMAIDGQGRPHILWDTLTPQAQFIYRTYLSAQGWTTPTVVANSLGSSSLPYPPIVDQTGTIHLVWRNSLTTLGPLRLLYTYFGGGQWSAEEQVYQLESGSFLQGLPHLDATGQVNVTFWTGSSYSMYHTAREETGWSTPVHIPRPHTVSWIWPDQRGGVHLYGGGFSDVIHYSYWRDGQFVVENVQTSGTLSGRDTQLDGLDYLRTFWVADVPVSGGSVKGLYYQRLNESLEWDDVQVLSGEEAVGYRVLKATDWGARFALAWQEASRHRIRLNLWQGDTLRDRRTFPLPRESSWNPMALALSPSPNKLCLLASRDDASQSPYAVICADILREMEKR